MAEEAPKSISLEDLTRYESAAVSKFYEEGDPQLSFYSIDNFYQKQKKDMYEDPIWLRSYKKVTEDVEEGFMRGRRELPLDIVRSIEVYNNKYESAFEQIKLGDLTSYLTEGYTINDEVKKALNEYKDLSIKDLAGKLKDSETSSEAKKGIEKAVSVISLLKGRRLREKGVKLYNSLVTQQLDSLYPKQEKNK